MALGLAAALALVGCSGGAPAEHVPSGETGTAPGGSGMAMGAAPECPATADVAQPPQRVITMDAAGPP